MTLRRAVRTIGRAQLQLLVWILEEPMIWLPLAAILFWRLALIVRPLAFP